MEPRDRPVTAVRPDGWLATAERLVLLPLAALSAMAWAIGVTVLQPLSEPTGPHAIGENNTYWARELRFGALIAVILVLIVVARADRRATRAVCLGGLLWLAADLGLDRIDQASGTVPLAAGAALVAVAGCAVAWALPGTPRPATLLTVGAVAAVASGLVTLTESPTDTETALHVGSAAVAFLLALVAVAAGAAAGTLRGFRAATTVAAGVVLAAAPPLLRHLSPQPSAGRVLGVFAFTALLVAVVAELARGGGDYPLVGAAVIAAVVLPVMWMPLMLASIMLRLGTPFTVLAANPPVNAADEDIVLVLLALPIGLVLGRVLRAVTPTRPA
ncbi:hypothetical protein [Actinoplanes sp. NPDC049802]|uniref:hypothetical protein n=1 Tax=Actinoplanes sp. NPDC049802 TaxID=3154742 RepID=UPI003400431C